MHHTTFEERHTFVVLDNNTELFVIITWHHTASHRFASHHIKSHHIATHCIASYYIKSHRIASNHQFIASRQITLCHYMYHIAPHINSNQHTSHRIISHHHINLFLTSHCISPHYIMKHHCLTSHCTAWYNDMTKFHIAHIATCPVPAHRITYSHTLHHITLPHIASPHITSHHITSHE